MKGPDGSRMTLAGRNFGDESLVDRLPWLSVVMHESSSSAIDAHDRAELDHLFSVTYEELRRLASAVRRSDPGASITPTALVNEAWLKLARTPRIAQTSPLHFRRIAARAMRQVLIEAARRRTAGKRDASAWHVTFDAEAANVQRDADELLALDAALGRLAVLSPRQAHVVEARFFGGLSMPETAAVLGVSESTALREWRLARAWLARELATER